MWDFLFACQPCQHFAEEHVKSKWLQFCIKMGLLAGAVPPSRTSRENFQQQLHFQLNLELEKRHSFGEKSGDGQLCWTLLQYWWRKGLSMSAISMSTGSKGTEMFWQCWWRGSYSSSPSLKLHLWALSGSPYPVTRAEVLVRYLGPFPAVPSNPGFEMSTYLHKCCPAYFPGLQVSCGRYRQLFCTAPAYSGGEEVVLFREVFPWAVSLFLVKQESSAFSTVPEFSCSGRVELVCQDHGQQIWNIDKDGASLTSLCNLCQCSVTLTTNKENRHLGSSLLFLAPGESKGHSQAAPGILGETPLERWAELAYFDDDKEPSI